MTANEALSLTKLHGQLLDVFLRYYDTAYNLRDEGLMAERQRLLRNGTTLLQQPYVELLPEWESASGLLAQSCEDAQVPELAGLLSAGMMRGVPRLYWHQHETLQESINGRHVVITSVACRKLFYGVIGGTMEHVLCSCPGPARGRPQQAE